MKMTNRGCTCCNSVRPYGPHTERDETPDRLVEHLSIDERKFLDDAMELFYIDSSRHEAGHVVAAAVCGRKTKYVTIGGGAPHVHYLPNEETPSVLDLLIATSAGAVAERVGNGSLWGPTWSSLADVVRKARAGEAGTCDACHTARMLVAYFPHCSDETLVESWFGVIAATHAVLNDDEARGAMLTLGRELHEHTLLEQPRVDEILSRYELSGAMDRALGPLNLDELLPEWRRRK